MRHLSAALIICAGLGLSADVALASTCTNEIARLQKSAANVRGERMTAPQSLAAQLHHQPTPASVNQAKDEAQGRVEALLAEAKHLDSSGEGADCLAKVGEAKSVLGVR